MRAHWLLVIGTLVSGVASADVPGTVTQLSTGSAVATQNSPAISGTQVVWTNVEAPANFDIVLHDLTTSAGMQLTGTPDEREWLQDIDAGNVVYTHASSTVRGDIVLNETATGRRTILAQSTSGFAFQQPAIRGRWVTFLRVSSQIDIDLYDHWLGISTPVTNDAAAQGRPRIGGDHVVYEDYTSGSADVLAYPIPAGPAFVVASGPGEQVTPDADGNTVVYVDSASGTDQLWAFDLTTMTKRQLTTVASSKLLPRISGSRIVWADDRNAATGGGLDLYLYDLNTNTEDRLVVGPGDQFLADIDGDRIVYTDNSSGFEQIKMFAIAPPPPPGNLPHGCDPLLTDAVGAPMTFTGTTGSIGDAFSALAGRTYWVCIENGRSDGSARATHARFAVDQRVIVNTSDFRAQPNPPRYIDSQIKTSAGSHAWAATLFGPNPPSQITVTIRVDK